MNRSDLNPIAPHNAMRLTLSARLVILAILALLLLTACSTGKEVVGVELEPIQHDRLVEDAAPAADAPAESSAAGDAGAAGAGDSDAGAENSLFALEGRLMLLQGGRFVLYDLASGEITPLDDLNEADGERPVETNSAATFNPTQSNAIFFAFPNFGAIDLQAQTVRELQNTGSFPNTLQISPDGRWMFTITSGGYITRLILLSTDGQQNFPVAGSSSLVYGAVWTVDSRLLWWEFDPESEAPLDPELQLFDVQTGESAPLGDEVVYLTPPDGFHASPNGDRAVRVALAPGPENVPSLDFCYDSYIETLPLPVSTGNLNPSTETIFEQPGLVATSPKWRSNDELLLVWLGSGECGAVTGDSLRQVARLDLNSPTPQLEPVAGPLGNADTGDIFQQFGNYLHLFSLSPDGDYLAWIGGGIEAGESLLNLTHIPSGETAVILRRSPADFEDDEAQFVVEGLLRQVVWLR